MYGLEIKITKYFGCNGVNSCVFLFVQKVQSGVWAPHAWNKKSTAHGALPFPDFEHEYET